jgi:hypothetical protein
VLIDCPPNLGLLSVNALAAAHEVLVPVETYGTAAVGLRDLMRTIEDARESQVNPTLAIGAIAATRFNRRRPRTVCSKPARRSRGKCCRPLFGRAPALVRRLVMPARSWSTTPGAWQQRIIGRWLVSYSNGGSCP